MENDGKPNTTPQLQNAGQTKNLNGIASLVAGSVTGKLNANSKTVKRRMALFEPEKGNSTQMSALSTIES